MFLSTARPGDVWRGLAPTIAIDRGENSLSRRYVDIGKINPKGRSGFRAEDKLPVGTGI
jgi:hypothetical protein